MRKGSTSLGSLGRIPPKGLLAVGMVLLILPLASLRLGAGIPVSAASAAEQAASPSAKARQAARKTAEKTVREEMARFAAVMQGRSSTAAQARANPRAGEPVRVGEHVVVKTINTRATWYGPGFHGRRTASGERFNSYAMTLASRHLPFGTKVRVTNPRTGRSAVARVNDRGPFRSGYTADLSQGLARRIGLGGSGPIKLEVLRPAAKKKPAPAQAAQAD